MHPSTQFEYPVTQMVKSWLPQCDNPTGDTILGCSGFYLFCNLIIFFPSDPVNRERILHECFRLLPLVDDFPHVSMLRIIAFLLL